jgi:cytochrome c oxidase subunit IV
VVTAVEIGISYIDVLGPAQAPLLIIFGVVKFVTVVAVFMHLRYDLPGYRTLFLFGLIGALVVFAVVLAVFQAF